MKIVFRVDASSQIGSGHVMRCLTLGEGFRERGAEILFVCRELEGHLCTLIRERGFDVHPLPVPGAMQNDLNWCVHAPWLEVPWSQDAEETVTTLQFFGHIDWLVVDHYSLDSNWERLFQGIVTNIMVIDDLADRPHDCDLLLDQNFYAQMEKRYSEYLPAYCEQLLGPRFALLRSEFSDSSHLLRERDGSVRKILVFYGGVDASNETAKALEAIQGLKLVGLHVDVVVGQSNPNRGSIETICSQMANVTFHCQVTNMSSLMAEADLALGSGGSVTWERFCLGLPAIVTTVAANQEALTADCAEVGALFWLGRAAETTSEDIANALRLFLGAPHALKSYGHRCIEYVDGRGVQRVVGRLIPPAINLRKAAMEDCASLHIWRNAEETRRYIFGTDPIPLDAHRKWFKDSVENPNRIILIGEIDGVPVGVLRYDVTGLDALISVYLVPGTQGQGIGTQLVRVGSLWLKENLPQVLTVKADVMSSNVASMKAFINAGYKEHHMTFEEVLH